MRTFLGSSVIVASSAALREELNLGRKLGPRTVIVASSAALREELSHKLGPPDFGVVVSKPSLSAVGSQEFPRDERCLFVIETAENGFAFNRSDRATEATLPNVSDCAPGAGLDTS